MGFVDAIEIGDKKLTVQTEYFPRPNPRAETKVYLGGALKKVYTEPMDNVAPEDLQRALVELHQTKLQEIVAGLRQKMEEK